MGIESWPDAEIDRDTFQHQLWYSAQNLLGDAGSAPLDLSVLRFRFADGSGEAIVRTRRGHVDTARAAIACLEAVDDHPVGLRVHATSGTIRVCEEKYMGHAPEESHQRHVVFGDAERAAFVREGRVDVRANQAFTGATALDTDTNDFNTNNDIT